MTGRARAVARPLRLAAAAALLAAAACHHENPSAPEPVLHAIEVSARALATAEGGPPATFDVALRSRPDAPVEVEVRSEDPAEGLVLAPGYALPAAVRELSFTPDDWDVPRRVTVHPVDDPVVDGTAQYAVTLGVTYTEDAAYAAVPAVAVAVSNADDDAPGIMVSALVLATEEGGPPARLQVRLLTPPSQTVQVSVESGDVAEGLIGFPGGWTPCSSAYPGVMLQFDAGNWNEPRQLDVCPQDDPDAEPPRTYGIRIRTAGWAPEYEHVPEWIVTVTNTSDEVALPALVIEPIGPLGFPLVTAENGATDAFTVRLAAPPLADVVVPVTSEEPGQGLLRTASSGPAASVSLVFTAASWSLPQAVTVVGQDDTESPVIGVDVPYSIVVGPPSGADPAYPSLAPRTLAAVNLDDDLPALTIDPAGPLSTSEDGASAAFTLSIRPPRSEVVVRVTSGDPGEALLLAPGSEAPSASVDVTFTTTAWSRAITIVGQPDGVLDGDQSCVVTVAVVRGDAGYLALAPQGLTVTNLDRGVVFTSADVPRTISDLATVTSLLTVTNGPGAIRSMTSFVTLTHTYDGDLVLELVSPSGTVVTLAAHRGGNGDDFAGTTFDDGASTPIEAGAAPFQGSYRPDTPLAALSGENANGVWTLRIRDEAGGDVGTLVAWGVTVR